MSSSASVAIAVCDTLQLANAVCDTPVSAPPGRGGGRGRAFPVDHMSSLTTNQKDVEMATWSRSSDRGKTAVLISASETCVAHYMQVGWADMQQITGHMGQEPYSSAQMIGSATAVLLTVLLGIVCYLFMLGPLSHHQPHPQPISKLPT